MEGLARDLVQGYLVHSKEMTDEIRVDFDLRIPRSHSTIPRPARHPALPFTLSDITKSKFS
ncbi:hypothetical protein Barb6XT_01669 [Bacteroidales bacterium Barb6XT]|nr:hypothetical protein Barb6XT_01669 [Bacteroidales bacterium Barb6XT]